MELMAITRSGSRLLFNVGRKFTEHLITLRAAHKFVNIETNSRTGVATLTMQRPPVNALNLEFLQELTTSLQTLEQSKCSGLILTATPGKIFSSGLDLNDLRRRSDIAYLREFWQTLQDLWCTLFSLHLPTAAAINGHAPAGGCLLAISCDYRVMVERFTIGLNEARVGLAVPSWVIDTFKYVLPSTRVAERELTQGRIMTSEEALKLGLVDEVVENHDRAIEKCEEFFMSTKEVKPSTYAHTKLLMRSAVLQKFELERDDDLERFLRTVQSDEMQAFLENYLRQMKQMKGK